MIWAIVIGIDDYRGREPTLQSAVYDAEQFSRWLVDSVGVKEERIRKLLGRRPKDSDGDGTELVPTKDNVLKAINEVMLESGGAGEALFFFYGGHGVTAEYANREESALVFPGLDRSHPVQTLAVRSITEFFETTRFQDQFFFIDACRSPLPTSHAEIGAWQIPRRRDPGQDPPQQFVLYATSPGRTAEDATWPREHSAFSSVLLDGLRGKGPAKAWSWERGCYEVRWERLATYVKTEMERKRTKKSGEIRYPFQIPQDVGIRGVADQERDALLARPPAGEIKPEKLTLDLEDESIEEAVVTVLDASGIAVATAVRVTGSQEFTLPPRTYAARVETTDGRIGHILPPVELYAEATPKILWLEDGELEQATEYAAGTIAIESQDPLAVADVRDETGRFVGVATQDNGCEAWPGFYRLRLVGPERDKTGEEKLVLLRSGGSERVKLEQPAADERAVELARAFGGGGDGGYVKPTARARPAVWAQPSTVVAAGIGAALQGDRTALDALGLGQVPALGDEGSGVAFFAVPGSAELRSLEDVRVRIWAAGDLIPDEEQVLRPTAAGIAAVLKPAETPEPHWISLETTSSDEQPTVVAVPLVKGRLATLVGQVDTDRIRLYQFHPPAQPAEASKPDWLRRLEHLQRQLLGGRLDGAQSLVAGGGADDEEAFVAPLEALGRSDPFGGCLAGYVLLRLGLREGLGALASSIIDAAPQLSDAYVLRGEYEAYMQNSAAANQAFADAVSAGIPAFGEGLTRLVEGLRASGFFHPRGALVRYIFQRHARGSMWAAFNPRRRFQPGTLVISGADIGYEA